MNIKKRMLIIVLMIMLCSLGCVFAEDNITDSYNSGESEISSNTTEINADVISTDSGYNEISSSNQVSAASALDDDENYDVQATASSITVTNDGINSYSRISDAISDVDNGGTVYLKSGGIFRPNDGTYKIHLSKDVTIASVSSSDPAAIVGKVSSTGDT